MFRIRTIQMFRRRFSSATEIPSKIPAHFKSVNSSHIMRHMMSRFYKSLDAAINSDVIVIGAGISGLVCAFELSKIQNLKVSLLDRRFVPGGTNWSGSQHFGSMCIRKPAHELLKELSVPYEEVPEDEFVIINHAALLTSTLIRRALLPGNVTFFGGFNATDVLVNKDTVVGAAVSIDATATHSRESIDNFRYYSSTPFEMNSTVLVSACGGLQEGGGIGGYRRIRDVLLGEITAYRELGAGKFDMNSSEDAIVHHTRALSPGLVIAGAEVATLDGLSQPGASNGAMIQSGIKAARLALDEVLRNKNFAGTRLDALKTAGHFIRDE